VLLMKLLFAQQPLSIQVHPDDLYAHRLGLPRGKTEAWYILSARPGARIALGLTQHLTRPELWAAIQDGTIENLVQWQTVTAGDVILVPAGTIHALGAGLVVAEIQQASDITFRLFDFGRGRALHVDDAVAVADVKPAPSRPTPRRLSDTRLLLAASPYFVLERISLPGQRSWRLQADQETWLLLLEGRAAAGETEMRVGDVLFLERDGIAVTPGPDGVVALVAYVGTEPVDDLLQDIDENRSRSILVRPLSPPTETAI
jgi:mannose-6-phosphate isomerase